MGYGERRRLLVRWTLSIDYGTRYRRGMSSLSTEEADGGETTLGATSLGTNRLFPSPRNAQ